MKTYDEPKLPSTMERTVERSSAQSSNELNPLGILPVRAPIEKSIVAIKSTQSMQSKKVADIEIKSRLDGSEQRFFAKIPGSLKLFWETPRYQPEKYFFQLQLQLNQVATLWSFEQSLEIL